MHPSSAGTSQRQSPRARAQASLLAALLVTGTHSAHAYEVVTDPLGLAQQIFQYVLDIQEYNAEAQRWRQSEQQIKDMRAIFNPLQFQMSLPEGMNMDPVADDYLVDKVCGKGSGASLLQKGFSALNLGGTSAIKEEQQKICVSIQMAQNRKYNDSLHFLKETIEQLETAQHENYESRNTSNNTSGGVQAAQSDSVRLGNQLQVLGQEWSTRMQAYDAYIAAMQTRQNVIAKAAFKGDSVSRVVTDVAKTVALKKALDQWVNE